MKQRNQAACLQPACMLITWIGLSSTGGQLSVGYQHGTQQSNTTGKELTMLNKSGTHCCVPQHVYETQA